MKISISLSADSFTKGDRVAVHVHRNEWLVGTVTRVGTAIFVTYDNGDEGVVNPGDFKHVKAVTVKPSVVRKRPITDAAVKILCAKKPRG